MNSTVRLVADADLDLLLEMNNAVVPAVNELARSDLEWFAEVAHSFLVVENTDGGIDGFIVGLHGPGVGYDSGNYHWFCEHYDRFIYVDRVVVAESTRGKGTGQLMYDSFVSRGRVDGHDLLLCEVNTRPRNDVSLRFHERYGFKPVGEREAENDSKTVVMLALGFV